MKEEIRILYSQYFQLAKSVYLTKAGGTNTQAEWLIKKTVSYKIVGQYEYFEKKELMEYADLILKIIDPLSQVSLKEIEGSLFYLFTIQKPEETNNYSMEEKLWLHLWNCTYLDMIRQLVGGLEGRIPKLSLGPGFYNIDMETADEIYQLLEGQKYGISMKNHMFIPSETCAGLILYGEAIEKTAGKPCKTCKGTKHCEFCIF